MCAMQYGAIAYSFLLSWEQHALFGTAPNVQHAYYTSKSKKQCIKYKFGVHAPTIQLVWVACPTLGSVHDLYQHYLLELRDEHDYILALLQHPLFLLSCASCHTEVCMCLGVAYARACAYALIHAYVYTCVCA